jgi:NAD(P)-dependent dehydrogenase (short-subunit alcohol dehydrogenase family)
VDEDEDQNQALDSSGRLTHGEPSGPAEFAGRAGAALVLGASGGLGSAIAAMLLTRGSRVAMTYRRPSSAVAELAARSPDSARAYQLELTDAAACARVATAVAEDFGVVHTVVYAVGPHVPMTHLSNVKAEVFRGQLEQDAIAFLTALVPLIPLLRVSQGSLVAVTTAATTRYAVRDGLSSIPKAAIEAAVRGIAAEEGRFGVRANCVGPGMLTDGMATRLIGSGDLDERALEVARRNIPLRRFGTAPDWYPATKAAITGYTRHLATYSRDQVRANAVAPGMTDTPRLAGFTASEIGQRVLRRIPAGRLARPDEIAWAILFLLSPLASYINGALLVVDGGWTVTQ